MKKLFLALMAVMAIALTSCKHETCTLYVENNYSKNAIVLFSHDKECRSMDEAEIVAIAEPGKVYAMKKVKLNGLYAIAFVCTSETPDANGIQGNYEYKNTNDLNEFVGMANVNIVIGSNGYAGVDSSSL